MMVEHHRRIDSDQKTEPTKVELDDETGEERAKRVWKVADCVCFDVDSTVCRDEAIDELANFLGVGEAVSKATKAAMNGNTRFREALRSRLNVMKPSKEQIEKFKIENPPKLTPGIDKLISALHNHSIPVYLVSGGFRSLIEPVADCLKISRAKIYANQLLFNENGSYAGFDENELTSDSGSKEIGKPGVCALLKKKYGYENLVMIGDGATDYEAFPPADAFIGFGGNQIRENVRTNAPWYVYDFEVLRRELEE